MALADDVGGADESALVSRSMSLRFDAEILQRVLRESVRTSPGAFLTTLGDIDMMRIDSWEKQIVSATWAVIERERNVVGVVAARFPDTVNERGYSPTACFIDSLWINPEIRGHGLGERLIRFLIEAQLERYPQMRQYFATVWKSNISAIRLLERTRFIKSRVIPGPDRAELEFRLEIELDTTSYVATNQAARRQDLRAYGVIYRLLGKAAFDANRSFGAGLGQAVDLSAAVSDRSSARQDKRLPVVALQPAGAESAVHRTDGATVSRRGRVAGHVFISYVREDSHRVDQLQRRLQGAGIPVWRDTADLWPGEDWRIKIRGAITEKALVFIACFSHASLARRESYQNEELNLAIDQLRRRRPDDPWLIPVRFDECEIPDWDIGGGRTSRRSSVPIYSVNARKVPHGWWPRCCVSSSAPEESSQIPSHTTAVAAPHCHVEPDPRHTPYYRCAF